MPAPLRNFVLKFLSLFFLFHISAYAKADAIIIENYLTDIEIANTFEKRKKGLMNRAELLPNAGMFFIWDKKKIQCMWMKNTSLELNIAFISNQGEILEIFDMIPFSVESICSSRRVKYALEVNKNWFKDNNINVGDRLNLSFIND
jgi:uncharacterized membrane protein (UPF0127 family)